MEEIKKIKKFIVETKWSTIIILLFLIFAYGQRIISNSFSIDTELYMNQMGTPINFDWWNSLNRWGLVWLNKIVQLDSFPIFASNFCTVVTIFIYAIMFNYVFFRSMKEEWQSTYKKIAFVFPIIFITNPIWAEQYNFIHQNFGVALGIFFVPLSLLLFEVAKEENQKIKKLIYDIVGISLAVVSFGVYQSIILLYIISVVFLYFLNVIKYKDNCWKYLFRNILIFGIIIIFYEIITKMTGDKATYLQIAWENESVTVILKNIYYVVKSLIKCEGMFYNIGYLIAIVLFSMSYIYILLKKKMKIGLILSYIGIILSPLYIVIITGANQYFRTQFNYSFFIGLAIAISILVFNELKNKNIVKYISYGIIIGVICLSYRQAYTTSNLFNSADIVFENDTSIARNIQSRIEQASWYNEDEEYTLIFVGGYNVNAKRMYIKGEIIGSSFFDFCKDEGTGVTNRTIAFFELLGYKYNRPTYAEYEDAKKYIQDNKIEKYPKLESIGLMDKNKIVINLSDI